MKRAIATHTWGGKDFIEDGWRSEQDGGEHGYGE